MIKTEKLSVIILIVIILVIAGTAVYKNVFVDKGAKLTEKEAIYGKNGEKSGAFIEIRQSEPLFEYGPAPVQMNYLKPNYRQYTFYIGKDGKKAFDKEFYYARPFTSDGLALITERDGTNGKKYGYIDKTGKSVTKAIYDYAYDFENGTAVVNFEGCYGLIDTSGEYILQPIYYDWDDTFKGCYVFYNKGADILVKNDGTFIKELNEEDKQNTEYFDIPDENAENAETLNMIYGVSFGDGYDVENDKTVKDPSGSVIMQAENCVIRFGENLFWDNGYLKNKNGELLYKNQVDRLNIPKENKDFNLFFADRKTRLIGLINGSGRVVTKPVYKPVYNDFWYSSIFYIYSTDGYAYVAGEHTNYLIDSENNIVLDMNEIVK
ncbi:MAG: WG repeat-containing protein [Firmicutes bacterium]|nr:WG repeat-containing protein [Bacillota bacterium]